MAFLKLWDPLRQLGSLNPSKPLRTRNLRPTHRELQVAADSANELREVVASSMAKWGRGSQAMALQTKA